MRHDLVAASGCSSWLENLVVVIVNWNTRDLLARCLESVRYNVQTLRQASQSLRPETSQGGPFERSDPSRNPLLPPVRDYARQTVQTFVVDNASSDGSATMVKEQFPWVRLIENDDNVGFARANNQAIGESSGEAVLLLNSDAELRPGALKTLIEALQTHPEAGAVGPRVLNPDGTLQSSYGSLPSVAGEIIGSYWLDWLTKPWGWLGRRLTARVLEGDHLTRVDRVSFACTLIRREALDQVGLLDVRFAFYSEDYDWFKRLRDAGWQAIFCPAAQVVHAWGGSSGQRSEWALSQLYKSKRLYFAKHHGAGAERALRIGLLARFAVLLVLSAVMYPLKPPGSPERTKRYRMLIGEMLAPL